MTASRRKILNRELSWLHFNARVLQETLDPDTPLIEKIRFLGIYSNNLDEFFRVRVATLNRMKGVNSKLYHEVKVNPRKTLKMISRIDKENQSAFLEIFKSLLLQLAEKDIHFITDASLTPEQGAFVERYFQENVRPRLFPIMLGNLRSSSLMDRSLYMAVILQVKGKPELERYALIEVPVGPVPRFLVLPAEGTKKNFMLLDDVIRYCLSDIFSVFGYNSFSAYAVKFTRDSELDIDNDVSKSFLAIMAESIKQREAGQTVRFTYDSSMPDFLLSQLLDKFQSTKSDTLVPSGRYHNIRDFTAFPNLGGPELVYTPLSPLHHPMIKANMSLLDQIRKRDILLHLPYQSFQYLIDLLREASLDTNVRSIKMTLYRVAAKSSVVNALINAARNGKEVTVFLELQARFDEEANIYWSEKMQQEGVKVIQSIPGFKVHSKLLLIRRKEAGNKNMYYSVISTGNFNESTAKVYSDIALFTADKAITSEINTVFHLFDSKYSVPRFKHLVVSPFYMRSHFIRLINYEIRQAKKGNQAGICLKLNSLVDEKCVNKLYEASRAGVKVKLIIRGICVLVPGTPGLSENIEAVSIVDRYLEHSRIFVFHNGGDPRIFISSADWMVRNFDHRIETACPIYDPELKKEILTILDIQFSDNSKSRLLNSELLNEYRGREKSEEKVQSQPATYQYFQELLTQKGLDECNPNAALR